METSKSITSESVPITEYLYNSGHWEESYMLPVYHRGDDYTDWLDEAGVICMTLRHGGELSCERFGSATFYLTIYTRRYGWLACFNFIGQEPIYVHIRSLPNYFGFMRELSLLPTLRVNE